MPLLEAGDWLGRRFQTDRVRTDDVVMVPEGSLRPFVEHQDLIRRSDGAWAMRDNHDRSPLFFEITNGLSQSHLALGIQI